MACRLCLHVFKDDSRPVEDNSWKNLLPNILPQIMLDLSSDPAVCDQCVFKLEENESFREVCKEALEKVNLYIYSLPNLEYDQQNDLNIDLEDVLTYHEGTEKTGQEICRICFQYCINESFSLFENNIYEVFVKSLFLEPIIENIRNPVLCRVCADRVEEMYLFQQMCLDVENMLQDYAASDTLSEEAIGDFAKDIGHILTEDGGSTTTGNSVNSASTGVTQSELVTCTVTTTATTTAATTNTLEAAMQCLESESNEDQQDENRNFLNGSVSPSTTNDDEATREDAIVDPLTCPHCGFVVKKKNYLKEHIYVKHTVHDKFYQCPHCDFRTVLKRYLRAHTKSQHTTTIQVYKCIECKFQSRQKWGLKRHIQGTHLSKEARENAGKILLFCMFCDYKTKREGALKMHLSLEHPCTDESQMIVESTPETDSLSASIDMPLAADATDILHASIDMPVADDATDILNASIDMPLLDNATDILGASLDMPPVDDSTAISEENTISQSGIIITIPASEADNIPGICIIVPQEDGTKEGNSEISQGNTESQGFGDLDYIDTQELGDLSKVVQIYNAESLISPPIETLEASQQTDGVDITQTVQERNRILFNSQSLEERDQMIFEAGPPYVCPICNYNTKRKHDMKRHLYNIHSKVHEMVRCDVCDYQTKSKDNLQKHIKYKHVYYNTEDSY